MKPIFFSKTGMLTLALLLSTISASADDNNQSTASEKDKPADCGCQKIPSRFETIASANPAEQAMAKIPAGTFMMGGDTRQAKRDELPKHTVYIDSFALDTNQVTNEQFHTFVISTGYVTEAEKKPDWEELKKQLPANTPKPDDSKLFAASLVFTPPAHPVSLEDYTQWWTSMSGANWRHPRGPESSLDKLNKHPVVHVSWNDAYAYCQWIKKRLPTEAEWEWAARGGLENKPFPWGDEPIDTLPSKANTWQGEFPYNNTLQDQYYYTSPVKSFSPNGYGLYDMAGNVWEWASDWYHHDYYKLSSKDTLVNPQGPTNSYDPNETWTRKKVLRGGSFLCNESYCTGYRVSARMKFTPDTSMEHIGFRCAK